MKKIILFAIILASCSKQPSQIDQPQDIAKKTQSLPQAIIEQSELQQHTIQLINQCYPETVNFTGTINYDIKEIEGESTYIIYSISFFSLSGIGELSHLKYSGGGGYMGKIPTALDPSNPDVLCTKSLILTYRTNRGNTLVLNELVTFMQLKDGSIKAFFYETPHSCK